MSVIVGDRRGSENNQWEWVTGMAQARDYSREFRMDIVRRLQSGESVKALADELGIHRKLLYQWRRQVAQGGESNLRPRGRPRKDDPLRAATGAEAAVVERIIAQQNLTIRFLAEVTRRLQQTSRPKHVYRECVYESIATMLRDAPTLSVEAMCRLTGLTRCGYYRYRRNGSRSE